MAASPTNFTDGVKFLCHMLLLPAVSNPAGLCSHFKNQSFLNFQFHFLFVIVQCHHTRGVSISDNINLRVANLFFSRDESLRHCIRKFPCPCSIVLSVKKVIDSVFCNEKSVSVCNTVPDEIQRNSLQNEMTHRVIVPFDRKINEMHSFNPFTKSRVSAHGPFFQERFFVSLS